MNIDSIFDVMSDFAHNRCVFISAVERRLQTSLSFYLQQKLSLSIWDSHCVLGLDCVIITINALEFFFFEKPARPHIAALLNAVHETDFPRPACPVWLCKVLNLKNAHVRLHKVTVFQGFCTKALFATYTKCHICRDMFSAAGLHQQNTHRVSECKTSLGPRLPETSKVWTALSQIVGLSSGGKICVEVFCADWRR